MSHGADVPYCTTLRIRDACLCLHVHRAARALGRRFDAALRPLNLTNGQFSLLMALNRPEPAGMTGVASLLAVDRTTLTAALKPLERRALIEVLIDPKDRRGRRLVLTAAGRDLLAQAVPVWDATQAAVERLLPAETAPDRFRDALQTMA